MKKHIVIGACSLPSCQKENLSIEVNSRFAALETIQTLNHHASDTCKKCGQKSIRYEAVEKGEEEYTLPPKWEGIRKVLKDFIHKSQDDYILKEYYKEEDKKIKWCIVSEDEEYEYEKYNKKSGSIATVKCMEQTAFIYLELGENHYNKKTLRELSKEYPNTFVSFKAIYNKHAASYRVFNFRFASESELRSFLNRAETLFHMHKEWTNDKLTFVFGIKEEKKSFNETQTWLYITEKEDWEAFKQFLCEYEHDESEELKECIKEIPLKPHEASRFKSELSPEELRKEVEKKSSFSWNEEFERNILIYN